MMEDSRKAQRELRAHVVYSPDAKTLSVFPEGERYVEVWRGLPDLAFEKTKSRRGDPSLVYKSGENYVYVITDAVRALERDSSSILVANLKKRGGIEAYWVNTPRETFGSTLKSDRLTDIIRRATEINGETLKEVRKRLKGETQ